MNRNNVSSRLSEGHLDAVLLGSVSKNVVLAQAIFHPACTLSELALNFMPVYYNTFSLW